IKPVGTMACPSWSQQRLQDAAAKADCDNDNLAAYFPSTELWSHYGMAYQADTLQRYSDNAPFPACGTQQDPCYQEPGSLGYPAASGGLTRSMAEIVRP